MELVSPAPARAVTAVAPAKINLHLGVGDLRADGYHDLLTVYRAVDLWEEVTVALVDPGGGAAASRPGGAGAGAGSHDDDEITVTVSGPGAGQV
ncbi:hypothetical protein G6015_05830, partial [Dietzia sp. SLG510A3-40A3]|nr:hypothetical protein [Dietzia sp. SLG510A3-40A3]